MSRILAMGSPFSTYSPSCFSISKNPAFPLLSEIMSFDLIILEIYSSFPVNLIIPSFDRKLRIASTACFDEEGSMVSVVVVYKENAFTPHICQL